MRDYVFKAPFFRRPSQWEVEVLRLGLKAKTVTKEIITKNIKKEKENE